jgi:hypothetical protein
MRATILALTVLCAARPLWACSQCSCGDPTLTATGVEQPYRNRVRLGLEERYGDHFTGGDSWQHTYTLRSSLAATWAPIDRITLGLFVPWVTSWLVTSTQPRQTVNGLGDFELSARVLLWRDRRFAAHHLLWANAGLKMPTAPRLNDDTGHPYSDDDQPGSGSWDPFAGATYAWFSGDKWSIYASASYRVTTAGPRGYRRGSVLGWTSAAQLQPWNWGAFTLGLDGSWAQADQLANGNDSPNTGGTMLSVTPGLIAAPIPSLLLRLAVAVPVLQEMNGVQRLGPTVMLTLNYDVR